MWDPLSCTSIVAIGACLRRARARRVAFATPVCSDSKVPFLSITISSLSLTLSLSLSSNYRSMSLECFSLANPNPTLPFNNRASSSSSSLMAAFSSSPSVSHFSLQSQSFHRHRRPFLVARMNSPPLKGFGCGISMVKNCPRKNLRIVTFAASQEQSVSSAIPCNVLLFQSSLIWNYTF